MEKYKILNKDSFALKLNKDLVFDAIITDPPYNISQKNNFRTMGRSGIDFGEWDKGFDVLGWIKLYYPNLKKGGSILIFNSFNNMGDICKELERLGASVKDLIRWEKTNPMPKNIERRYVTDVEFCIWAVKPGKWTFNKGGEKYKRPFYTTAIVSGKEKLGHSTQKSLFLMKELIKTHTNENDLIIDPFMGSGTTGDAALRLNRRFIGIEKDKDYFDMAERRLKGVENENTNK